MKHTCNHEHPEISFHTYENDPKPICPLCHIRYSLLEEIAENALRRMNPKLQEVIEGKRDVLPVSATGAMPPYLRQLRADDYTVEIFTAGLWKRLWCFFNMRGLFKEKLNLRSALKLLFKGTTVVLVDFKNRPVFTQ